MDAPAQTPAPGPQAPTPQPDAAPTRQWYRGPTPRLAVATVVVAALATVLLTVAEVLWLPIDMGAIERADDAGWDESLLLPHQFALGAALMGAWVLSVAATVLAVLAMRRSRPWLPSATHDPA